MNPEDIALRASKLSREKLDSNGRGAAVMIETDLEPEECAFALVAALTCLDAAEDALIWCSGAGDFQDGGKAREGFERLVRPILDGMVK